MLHLKRWLDAHPEARPIHVEVFGSVPPQAAGIDASPVPTSSEGPVAGWLAISANRLHGYPHSGDVPDFRYFHDLSPVAHAGYSISIFHISPEEAMWLRRKLSHALKAEPEPGPGVRD